MDERNKRVIIVSIVALAIIIITASYAYFSARINGLESASTLSLTAGRMGIEYSEGDENVTAENIYPREDAWITKTFTLTGYNTTTQNMNYDLGIQIDTNTFKGGQLTFDLTGVGSNGTKIANITGKSITGQNRFFKIGTGSFNASDGDTHVYTLKIYFKELNKDQNINQGAVFNGKISVQEHASSLVENKCVYDGELVQGAEYVNGQYTYRYKQENTIFDWQNITEDGWGFTLTDKESTAPVTSKPCTSINGKPIVSMSFMFTGSKATSIDLSSFDTSNVTDMTAMFSYSQATSLDLSSFDTSNVTNMASMFSSNKIEDIIGLYNLDTSNVTDMQFMFSDTQITSLDLSSFDTSNVTNMYCMFVRSTVKNLNLSSFDTSNVRNMYGMFSDTQVTSLDLSAFDTSNVTNMSSMFANSKITTLDLRTFDTSKVIKMTDMFQGSQATNIDLSSFDTSNVTDMRSMFMNSANLTTIYSSDKFVTSQLKGDSSRDMFTGCTSLVGGAGTTYDANHIDKTYAHIDGGTSNPGYFTDIKDKTN